MRKILLLICCCIPLSYCFSQADANRHNGKTVPVGIFQSKEMIQPELAIYPNPAKNKITIQVKNFDPGMATVKVLDTKGKQVRQDNRLLTNGTEDIIMFLMLKQGIYFIIVSGAGKVVRKKIVIY